MYRTILVPLDGSPLGERALPYATAMARCSGARLLLLQVAIANMVTRNDPVTGAPQAVDLATQYLSATAERLQQSGLAAETVITRGEPGDEIVEMSRRQGADVIVMSTHGRSGVGRWLYGSVADHVLRHALAPILLVPGAAGRIQPTGEAGEARRVLVALDGSPFAEEALCVAGTLAETLGATLVLLRVIEPPSGAYDSALRELLFDPEAERAAAQAYLERMAKSLGRRAAVAVRVAEGSVAAAIAAFAREEGIDVIAMTTHGRGGLARLTLGSIATETVRLADVPMLLTRPTWQQGTGAGDDERLVASEDADIARR